MGGHRSMSKNATHMRRLLSSSACVLEGKTSFLARLYTHAMIQEYLQLPSGQKVGERSAFCNV
jgi:hypothetical protein